MQRSLRILTLLLLATALATSSAFACLNPIGRSAVGDWIYVEGVGPQDFHKALTTHEGKAHWLNILTQLKLERVHSRAQRVENTTNTAVAMLHLGMVKGAIRLLEKLEQTDPGLYYTAANLGTAYELNGENERALEWIKKGIDRNADAHNGTEWLHVKILEAKLALEKDPEWLRHNSVIGMHRLNDEQLLLGGPVAIGNYGHGIDLKEVESALIYQLHERLEFIKPPDRVVANLLFDLSRTLARTRGPEHAAVIKSFAQTYGPDLMPWQATDINLPAIDLPPPPAPMTAYWIGGIVLFVVSLALMMVVLKRRRLS